MSYGYNIFCKEIMNRGPKQIFVVRRPQSNCPEQEDGCRHEPHASVQSAKARGGGKDLGASW